MRFSITTLLLLTLLISLYFPLRTLFEPWQQARISAQHPFYAIQLDNAQLRDGDTIETASRIFPTLKFVEPNSDYRIKVEEVMAIMGKALPENADLYSYRSHGVDGMLTFQDGKLVMIDNHDDPVVVAQRSAITPSLWFRSGILPIYSLIASLVLATWVIFGKWYKSPNGNITPPGSKTFLTDA